MSDEPITPTINDIIKNIRESEPMGRCDHFDDIETEYDFTCSDEFEADSEEEACYFSGVITASKCPNSAWYMECPECKRSKEYEDL
jgi:hypothetical protein